MCTECAVSFEPVPAITGIVTASATARHSATFSSSVSTELSPVEPVSTSPSLPWAASQRARPTAASRSRAPSSPKGVTIAVITRPKRGASCTGLIAPSGYQCRRGAPLTCGAPDSGDLALCGRAVRERVLFLGGVAQVLEGDGAHLGEFRAQPPVGRVEQAQLLEV